MENVVTKRGNPTAVIVGFLLLAITGVLYVTPLPVSQQQFFEYTLPVRILVIIWVCRLANKNTALWGFLAFLIPGVALMIVGWRKPVKV